jgi:hypothetical protein
MTLTKFEKMREKIQQEAEEKLAKLMEEEKKERDRRIKPLISKYVNLFEDVLDKALQENVEKLENPKFKKTDIRKRLEAFIESELALIILEQDDVEDGSLPEEEQKKTDAVKPSVTRSGSKKSDEKIPDAALESPPSS